MAAIVDAQDRTEVHVARLIKQLGSNDYTEREQADAELAKLGASSKSHLEDALTDDDAEIQLRARNLLKQLQVVELWSPTTLTYRAEDVPVSAVMSDVSAATGNRVLVGEGYGNFQDDKVTVTAEDRTFWEVVDEVCRQSRNHIRPHYNPRRPGLVLVGGPIGKNPLTYSGPLRGQITSARKVFIEQFDYDDLDSDVTHTFQLNLQIMWEDRFRLVAYRSQPELVEAVTDTGRMLPATQPGASAWNVADPGSRQLTTSLRLHPPPQAATQIAEMRLRWGLIAVGDMTSIEFDDLTPERTHHFGDMEMTLEKIEHRPGSRWVVSVLVSRDLVVPEPQEILLHENELSLFDAGGGEFSSHGESNTLANGSARLKITFQGPTPESQPHRLRLTYPRIRSQNDVEIVFRDVPLPIAKPE